MPLVTLELQNIRIYERAKIEPNPHLNLIAGSNASGKTTLLEAIHLLGTGRSFRTLQSDQLRKTGSAGLSVTGKLLKENGELARLGLVYGADGRRMSVNGLEKKKTSQLAMHLPLQIISPDTHYDFQQYAKHRRGVLDWGLFHVEPEFTTLWTRYQRLLHQRNASLKDHRQNNARYAWDNELVETGELLQGARKRATTELQPHFQRCCQQLLGNNHHVELVQDSGWEGDAGFAASLHRDRERDRARGFTHSGPQRADLQLTLNAQASKAGASHGQYKIMVIALRLAQIQLLLETKGQACCLLIDDLAAELDTEHRARLTNFLAGLPVQVFVTATELSFIDRDSWTSHKTFHVEQGTISG